MTLRARILTLFALLGVVPILALGVFNYVQSLRAVEALLEAETGTIVRRIVADLEERYALRAGELLLLAENAETQRLYAAHEAGDDPVRGTLPSADDRLDAALRSADAYLSSAWELFRSSYYRIELRDTTGAALYTMATGPGRPGMPASDAVELGFPVRGPDDELPRGRVVAAVRPQAILPGELLSSAFGRAGYTVVLDRADGTVLHHASRRYLNQAIDRLTGPEGWNLDPGALAADSGTLRYRERDSLRVAYFVTVGTPPWTVIASSAVDEFAPPFLRTRTVNLVVMLLVAAAITLAFLLMTRRATSSLEQLTTAADDVAHGELSPQLPPEGSDEVGRLSRAFGLMVEEVRRMLERVEETRDMAVLGEFASQISHEIRNPLTSIKLNLQSLSRDVEAGRVPEDSAAPVRISLREVGRLERSVQRVLGMARTHPPERVPCAVHQVLDHAIEAVASQLEAQDVDLERRFRADCDRVLADPEDLEGVFVNLLVNAAEAMPEGGTVRVATSTHDRPARSIRVRVSDEGPGVPAEIRGQIFRPFVSTKASSTGFGLALARRTVEAHGGRIDLAGAMGEESRHETGHRAAGDDHRPGGGGVGRSGDEGGATFVVELPLAPESASEPGAPTEVEATQ